MMENKTIKDAFEEQQLSEKALDKNIDVVLSLIKTSAEMRHKECVLFSNPISFYGIKKLMEIGFSVSEFTHPFEQRKLQKVSW